jgi:hypothetical protein
MADIRGQSTGTATRGTQLRVVPPRGPTCLVQPMPRAAAVSPREPRRRTADRGFSPADPLCRSSAAALAAVPARTRPQGPSPPGAPAPRSVPVQRKGGRILNREESTLRRMWQGRLTPGNLRWLGLVPPSSRLPGGGSPFGQAVGWSARRFPCGSGHAY